MNKSFENLALLDGLHEQVIHLLLGGILGQEQDVEAGVSRGKPDTVYDIQGEGELLRNLSESGPFFAMISFNLASPPTGILSLKITKLECSRIKNDTAVGFKDKPASGELEQLSLVLQCHGVNRLPKPVKVNV